MTMNRFMHSRNPYKTPPDFKQLAIEYPDFRDKAVQTLSGHVRLDFRNPGAVWALTKSLLHRDYGLTVNVVPGRLVPTLPLRFNYLLWLDDLITANPSISHVHGIDIGTGASCIYSLLAAKHFSWKMLATDADEGNFNCAQHNVEINRLNEMITVELVSSSTFLSGVIDNELTYDFCMCNPPFHNENSTPKSRRPDRRPPRNAPTGTDIEVSAPGGEVAFVKKIIEESAAARNSVRIYTAMLGHKSSVEPLRAEARRAGARQTATSTFCQGRTTRWGLAWTFDPTIDVTGVKSAFEQENMRMRQNQPFTHEFLMTDGQPTYDEIVSRLTQLLDKLQLESAKEEEDDGVISLRVVARQNTWINSRRRRRQQMRQQSEGNLPEETTDAVAEGGCQYLTALVTVLELDDAIRVEITHKDGEGGRDASNQLLTYLKSRLSEEHRGASTLG